MRLFGRRSRGRHALGAAVTSIPSAPPPVLPAWEASVAVPVLPDTTAGAVAELLRTGEWAAEPAPAAVPVQAEPEPAPTRVQLGFRDGTSALLDAGSEQARALEQLAQSLARRD